MLMADYVMKQGDRLCRVHSSHYLANEFKPSRIGSGRFDPIDDIDGENVGVLYFAHSYIDAIAESIMRLDESGSRGFSSIGINDKLLSFVDLEQDIKLLDLEEVKSFAPLLRGGKENYHKLRHFANAVLQSAQYDSYHGFVWSGWQRGISGQRVLVLFSTRVPSENLKLGLSMSLMSREGYSKLLDASQALQCDISEYARKTRL
jgi:hypothetical protein